MAASPSRQAPSPSRQAAPSPARRASGTLTKRASGTAFTLSDVANALRPQLSVADVDVLGLPSDPPPPSAPPAMTPRTAEQQIVSLVRSASEVVDPNITSDALGEEECDWAAEALLLTHEPLRRDMAAMSECLEERLFGALPESWRVRAFFRFFSGWSALLLQQHAVELRVHYEWLAVPTGALESDWRRDLLAYHHAMERRVVAVGGMEVRILHELTQAADWTTTEPRSECAAELRAMVDELCASVLEHVAEAERRLPPLLRAHWGAIAPPDLITRAIGAAKRAHDPLSTRAAAPKGRARKAAPRAKLLPWMVYYLRLRDPERAARVVAQLSMLRRLRLALRVDAAHDGLLEHLRAIVRDEAPSWAAAGARVTLDEATVPALRLSLATDGTDGGVAFDGPLSARSRDKAMRKVAINSRLSAVNAARLSLVDPLGEDSSMLHRALAEGSADMSQAHGFTDSDRWWQNQKYQPNIWAKLNMDEPKAPRRI